MSQKSLYIQRIWTVCQIRAQFGAISQQSQHHATAKNVENRKAARRYTLFIKFEEYMPIWF